MSRAFPQVYVPVGGIINTTKGPVICVECGSIRGNRCECDGCVFGDYNCFGIACGVSERADRKNVCFKFVEEGGEKMKVNENGQIEYAIGECFAHHGRVFMCEMDDLYNPCVKCDFACDYSCDVRVACSETERSDGKSVRFVLLGGGGEK